MRYQPYFGHLAGDEAIVKPTQCGRFCVLCSCSKGENFREEGVVPMSNQGQLLCLQVARGLADSN
jgi:hypothetical protein